MDACLLASIRRSGPVDRGVFVLLRPDLSFALAVVEWRKEIEASREVSEETFTPAWKVRQKSEKRFEAGWHKDYWIQMKIRNYYRGIAEKPYHLSVGAVLVNEKNEVACHYFEKFQLESDSQMCEDFYILMRETVEIGDTLEKTVLRGLMEEFGAEGQIIDYIGSIQSQFNRSDVPIEKTTLYFLVKLKRIDLSRRSKDDAENVSEIRWHSVDLLIGKMKEQSKRIGRRDLDESAILERIKYFKSEL